MLNTDYKIATKTVAARIAKVLYIKGRLIGQNIPLIADIIECTKTLDNPRVSFNKTFTSVAFFFRLLNNRSDSYTGKSFLPLVSSFFELERGVRQGCPLNCC